MKRALLAVAFLVAGCTPHTQPGTKVYYQGTDAQIDAATPNAYDRALLREMRDYGVYIIEPDPVDHAPWVQMANEQHAREICEHAHADHRLIKPIEKCAAAEIKIHNELGYWEDSE